MSQSSSGWDGMVRTVGAPAPALMGDPAVKRWATQPLSPYHFSLSQSLRAARGGGGEHATRGDGTDGSDDVCLNLSRALVKHE
ncbi:hypothetical protein KIPB_006889, partial [Kipferlia bialata]|eukprot:g1843.t1